MTIILKLIETFIDTTDLIGAAKQVKLLASENIIAGIAFIVLYIIVLYLKMKNK